MKTLQLQDETYKELAKLARPLIDDADSLVLKLVRHYKKNHGPDSPEGVTPIMNERTRRVNDDKLTDHIRKGFKAMGYGPAIKKIFDQSRQERLGISAIIALLYDFPDDPASIQDRFRRAERSILIVLRNGPHSHLFDEPMKGIFQLKLGLEG